TPAVTSTTPASNASVSRTVSITAQINKSVAWINVYADGIYLASSPPLAFTWDSTTVVNGPHTISANAYNGSGTNIGSASINVTVANDTGLIRLRNTSTASANGTSLAINAPANLGPGDTLIVQIAVTAGATITAPSG